MAGNKKRKIRLRWLEQALNDFLTDDPKSIRKSFMFDLFILFLIFTSSIMFVAETYQVTPLLQRFFTVIDTAIIALFTIEYIARIYVAENRARYIFSWVGVIDFLAVVPFWVSFVVPWVTSLQFLRVLRIFKIFRFFQRHLDSKRVSSKYVSRVLVLKMIFVVFALLYISSALIFTIEAPFNPKINTFDDAVYFSLVTVTAVGFGDITPVTRYGRFVIMFIIMAGVLLIPVYLASLMRAFMLNSRKVIAVCQQCGLRQHDADAVYCKSCGARIYQEHDELLA